MFFFSRRHQKVAMLQVKRGQVAGYKDMKCQWYKQAMNFLVEVRDILEQPAKWGKPQDFK